MHNCAPFSGREGRGERGDTGLGVEVFPWTLVGVHTAWESKVFSWWFWYKYPSDISELPV